MIARNTMTPEQLTKLNSLTKYPSIVTYHELGDRGALKEDMHPMDFGSSTVHVAEKIDGTNVRILFLGDFFIVGSREELLYASGDLLSNPSQGIVEAVLPFALRFPVAAVPYGTVIYGEMYGGSLPESKSYTATKATNFRVFDVLKLGPHVLGLDQETAEYSRMRDRGVHGVWLTPMELSPYCQVLNLPVAPSVARLFGNELPRSLDDTYDFMKRLLPKTKVAIGEGGTGKTEGIILRNATRTLIAKARFEDYERTFKRRPAVSAE